MVKNFDFYLQEWTVCDMSQGEDKPICNRLF